MTQRDFRCVLGGVSLFRAEAALVFLFREGENWLPLTLPLWGTYDGLGSLGEVGEGPNADFILSAFVEAEAQGELSFPLSGQDGVAFDDIETVANIVACSQVQGLGDFRWSEKEIGFALLSAHMAAALMDRESSLDLATKLDDIAKLVLPSPLSKKIYGTLVDVPLRLRTKFCLSFLAFAALQDAMSELAIPWTPAGAGISLEVRQPELWLQEAMLRHSDSPNFLEAIEAYIEATSEEEPEILVE